MMHHYLYTVIMLICREEEPVHYHVQKPYDMKEWVNTLSTYTVYTSIFIPQAENIFFVCVRTEVLSKQVFWQKAKQPTYHPLEGKECFKK